MRIAVASIGQETCSFTPTRTTIATFEQYGLYQGSEILEKSGDVGPIGGFLAAAKQSELDLTVVPLIRGWAGAGGALTAETLAWFNIQLTDKLQAALPLDGFFFSLHGAAAAENEPDVEGALLETARAILGPDIPIVAALDHHANITERMIELLDGLVGHRTQPHDPFDTGKLAGEMLLALLRGDIRPTMAWCNIPMLTHQEQFLTDRGPMKRWFDKARAMEQESKVISVSPFPMQCWLDVPEGGWSTVVVTDNDSALAQRLANTLAEMAWSMREEFWVLESISPTDAVRQAESAEKGLVILSDTGDSVFGGAPGDSTWLLREMLQQQISSTALIPMVDAEVVALAINAGVDCELTVALGGKLAGDFHQPVEVTAKVKAIGGGRLDARIIGIDSFNAGRTVLLEVGPIKIVVSETEGVGGNHPIVYRQFGIEPADAKMAVLKTASNFQCYAEMTAQVLRVDTPGPTMSHLEQFNWQHVPRPIYPLDPLESWLPPHRGETKGG